MAYNCTWNLHVKKLIKLFIVHDNQNILYESANAARELSEATEFHATKCENCSEQAFIN